MLKCTLGEHAVTLHHSLWGGGTKLEKEQNSKSRVLNKVGGWALLER